MTEHTDRQALEELCNWPTMAVGASSRPWYRRIASGLWRFLTIDIWKEPLEMTPDDGPILRRIRVHEWATRGARRLRKLDRAEQREVLAVMKMLLGLDGKRTR